MHDHHVERDRQRRLEPVHDHPQRVAHQNHIDPAFIDQARGGIVIGSEHGNRLAALLLVTEIVQRDFVHQ